MDLLTQGEELEHEPILKQGMVLKRGRKITSQWKKRYFVLRPTTLSYHAGADTERAERRYIEITQSSTVTHRPDKHPLAFQVRTPGFRKITARCESEEELQLWMSAIEECIRRAPAWPIKCVVVGDDDETTKGKQFMMSKYLDSCRSKAEDGEAKVLNSHGYTFNKSRTRIVKTPDELGNVDLMLEYEKGEWVKLMLWYLDGREHYTNLRSLAYPNSDVFIIVFSVSDARSFEKVDSYLKEIKTAIKATPGSPTPILLLVGTRLSSSFVAVGFNQAEEKARNLGFAGYVECRLDSEDDCEQVFADAVRLVVEKTVVVYASNDASVDHGRQSSGILSSLANRLRKKNASDENAKSRTESDFSGKTPPSQSTLTTPADGGDSPDVSPSSSKRRGFGFFSSGSERLAQAAVSSPSRSQSKRPEDLPKTNSVRASAADGEEDSDEGSLIGVEIEETEEEAKARHEKDFGITDMKDDAMYTQKVLSRSNSRRSGDQVHNASHRSLGLNHDKDLPDIEETAAEERERELEELREKDAKRARELERMKLMMDNLKTHNKAIEDQLRAMREELAVVNKKGEPVLGIPQFVPSLAKPSGLSLPPSAVPLKEKSTDSTQYSSDLPPRAPRIGEERSSPALKASFRNNRAASVFF